jgi:hypothetical protein
MVMIPKIVHQTAKSKDLTWEERMLTRRIAKLLPGWSVRLWDDHDNLHLMKQHFPHYAERYEAISRGVMKADIARLVYMHAFGGFYMDTDYKLLKPFSEKLLAQRCIFGVEAGQISIAHGAYSYDTAFKFGNAFFGASRGHPFFEAMIDDIFRRLPSDSMSDFELMSISGPHGLTSFFKSNYERFPGIHFEDQMVFFPPAQAAGLKHMRDRSTVGIHLCWGSWRTKRQWTTLTVLGELLVLLSS